ncbi:hypothetical protein CINF_1598 [Candidatus Campylobacter infans]|uniref:Uncharacterized protein n=1 Tax=Candidatus Campylobacter infans TaxID=2561898 RepID=A0A7H9CIX4_9BACT|nr:hypothetical protein CINF_1598 [Candidatus Campylobacter infans]
MKNFFGRALKFTALKFAGFKIYNFTALKFIILLALKQILKPKNFKLSILRALNK